MQGILLPENIISNFLKFQFFPQSMPINLPPHPWSLLLEYS